MKKLVAFTYFAAILSCSTVFSQRSVELYGFAGYTGVNAEEWAGNTLREYERFTSGYYLQLFPYSNELVGVGIEYGYSYLLYYAFSDGTSNIERNVDATRLMAIARIFPQKQVFFEGGLGFYYFDGFTDFAVSVAAGYRFNLTDRFSIPVKFRNNFIFDSDANIIQPGLDAGVAFGF